MSSNINHASQPNNQLTVQKNGQKNEQKNGQNIRKSNPNYYVYSYSSFSQLNNNGKQSNKEQIFVNDNGQRDNYYRESLFNNDKEEVIKETGNKDLLKNYPPKFDFQQLSLPQLNLSQFSLPQFSLPQLNFPRINF